MRSETISLDLDDVLAQRLLGGAGVDPAELARAQEAARREGRALHRVLLDGGIVEEEVLLPLLCDTLGLPFDAHAGEGGAEVDRAAVERLTESFLRSRAAVPLLPAGDGPVPVLMADPADAAQREELAFLLDRPIAPRGALGRTVRALLAEKSAEDRAGGPDPAAAEPGAGDDSSGGDGPVIRFVNETLAEAVALGASDIHFESEAAGFAVRMRINGVLSRRPGNPAVAPASVFARLKVMARANVAERRLPQDARFSGVFSGRRIDFRLSCLPTRHGESAALRVLDPQALRLGWDQLGFAPEMVARVTRLIELPHGLFLVTGPTGSGKTTTLYTALAHLNSIRRKIVTVEDPVEYGLPGVQQVQVQDEIGLTFARVLRAILRHDPDVVMVGEIRDAETAEIACRAAQVGRMVLSTLHTRSAQGAATRLVDLGVPDYIVSDVLRGVLAQRLVVADCPDCGGSGCRTCGFSGVAPRRIELSLIEAG
ncbi:GspE/PulE family protein [Rubellimicrobium roseum]|uniref:Type II/IV secretion system protein n=1 Tax=Rubellimicrobium roseum TaxID=687525 RepID=A0A5C4NFF1_9RHOB|nr:GspE/PulE family protein [Rubellimicrobium roseum]TNC71357.1 type II/IV secretion system protein [Rubellimicrobium roseum]